MPDGMVSRSGFLNLSGTAIYRHRRWFRSHRGCTGRTCRHPSICKMSALFVSLLSLAATAWVSSTATSRHIFTHKLSNSVPATIQNDFILNRGKTRVFAVRNRSFGVHAVRSSTTDKECRNNQFTKSRQGQLLPKVPRRSAPVGPDTVLCHFVVKEHPWCLLPLIWLLLLLQVQVCGTFRRS